MRDPEKGWKAEREGAALAAAVQAGAPAPAFFGMVEVEGRPGLVCERLDGRDLLTRLSSRPWTVVTAGRVLGRVHAGINTARAPDELPRLLDDIRLKLSSPLVPADIRERALVELEGLPGGDRLAHGDMQPGNVLLTPAGPRAIDWSNASAGDPHADVARSLLMLRGGDVPGGLPRLVAALQAWGRDLLVDLYLRAYRRVHPLDMELVERWLPVRAADRLAEDIPAEHEWLLAQARAGLDRAYHSS